MFRCKYCSKTLTQKGNLNKHIHTIHNGHKDYNCNACGKSFSQASLKKHIQSVHQGHKNHKCESCGKSFSEAGHLKRSIEAMKIKISIFGF